MRHRTVLKRASILIIALLWPWFSRRTGSIQESAVFMAIPCSPHGMVLQLKATIFWFIFSEGNSRPAQVTSRILEEIYPDITALYDYEPDSKVSVVLNDRLDYAKRRQPSSSTIKLKYGCRSLDSPLRGSHNWLRLKLWLPMNLCISYRFRLP